MRLDRSDSGSNENRNKSDFCSESFFVFIYFEKERCCLERAAQSFEAVAALDMFLRFATDSKLNVTM